MNEMRAKISKGEIDCKGWILDCCIKGYIHIVTLLLEDSSADPSYCSNRCLEMSMDIPR